MKSASVVCNIEVLKHFVEEFIGSIQFGGGGGGGEGVAGVSGHFRVLGHFWLKIVDKQLL